MMMMMMMMSMTSTVTAKTTITVIKIIVIVIIIIIIIIIVMISNGYSSLLIVQHFQVPEKPVGREGLGGYDSHIKVKINLVGKLKLTS